MNYFLFDQATYKKLYNCSMLTDAEWDRYKEPNIVVGTIYIVMGILYQLAYIPCLIVMIRPEFIQHSAYKMMFYVGIIDVLATIDGGTLCGILFIRGDIYCTNQNFVFLVSIFTGSLWIGACITGFLLVVNRILDLLSPYYSDLLFEGKKTLIWLIIPTLFTLYSIFFTKPFIFNSIEGALFLNPYSGVDSINVDPTSYENILTVVNNIFVFITFPILYTVLPIIIHIKTKKSGTAKISLFQKQMMLQSFIICCFILMTAVIYIYMQYFYTPKAIHILAHFSWQASHGGAVFAYIFINRSIRNAIVKMFRKAIGKNEPSSKPSKIFVMKSYS